MRKFSIMSTIVKLGSGQHRRKYWVCARGHFCEIYIMKLEGPSLNIEKSMGPFSETMGLLQDFPWIPWVSSFVLMPYITDHIFVP